MNEQRQHTKVCVKCGQELAIANFYKSKTSKDGYSSYCKTCTNKSSAESKRKARVAKRELGGVILYSQIYQQGFSSQK